MWVSGWRLSPSDMCQVSDSAVWHTPDSSVITFGFLALLTSFFFTHPGDDVILLNFVVARGDI